MYGFGVQQNYGPQGTGYKVYQGTLKLEFSGD